MVRESEGEFGREATETDGARVSWVRFLHVATSEGATDRYRRWRVSFGMAPSETSPDGLQILSLLALQSSVCMRCKLITQLLNYTNKCCIY